MTQMRLDSVMIYDKTDTESILRHAAKLTGNTLNDLIERGEVIIGGTKGLIRNKLSISEELSYNSNPLSTSL